MIFFVVFIALAIVAIVVLVRMLRAPHAAVTGATPPIARAEDGALAELRMRYARGEIERDDFLAKLRDLGGRPPENPAASSA